MGRYVLGRLAAALPTLLLLTLVAFLLNVAAKGDPALLALKAGGQDPTPEAVAAYRAKLGLDDPLPVRYLRWVSNAVRGDFGRSSLDGRLVTTILRERIGPTLRLGGAAFAVAALVGISLGVLFGLFANSPLDVAGRFASLLLAAVPSFWLALLLIVIVGERRQWLPVAGYGGVEYLILPVIALACGPAASLMRYTRGATIEAWRQDYVRTARAKGLTQRAVALRHALRNAMLPILTIIGISLAGMLGGAVVIETVFNIPGMGRLLVQSVTRRDFPVVQGAVMTVAAIQVIVMLLIDVLYVYVDPRVRYGGD
jgi:peptide/nickel transport system permease protein